MPRMGSGLSVHRASPAGQRPLQRGLLLCPGELSCSWGTQEYPSVSRGGAALRWTDGRTELLVRHGRLWLCLPQATSPPRTPSLPPLRDTGPLTEDQEADASLGGAVQVLQQ